MLFRSELRKNGVILSSDERRKKIVADIAALGAKPDADLLETLTFITELPSAIKGDFNPDYLAAGVFITGGCARLRGLEKMAAEIFALPVQIGHSQTLNGPTSAIESPEYSTAIGLVRYALSSQRDNHQPPSPSQKFRQTFHGLIQKVRTLM